MDEFWNPALPIRGCVIWYNFLNGPMTWDLEDYKYLLRSDGEDEGQSGELSRVRIWVDQLHVGRKAGPGRSVPHLRKLRLGNGARHEDRRVRLRHRAVLHRAGVRLEGDDVRQGQSRRHPPVAGTVRSGGELRQTAGNQGLSGISTRWRSGRRPSEGRGFAAARAGVEISEHRLHLVLAMRRGIDRFQLLPVRFGDSRSGETARLKVRLSAQ